MEGFGVEHFVGVFDARMVRIYRRIGSFPEVLGQKGEGTRPNQCWALAFRARSQSTRGAKGGSFSGNFTALV